MRSLLSRAVGAAVMLSVVLLWSAAGAQPAPSAPDPAAASQRAEAAKLTDEAIAAEKAKNYTTAIALYQQAYRLEAHPLLMFNVGQVYMFIGNPTQAEKFYRRYLELDPMGPGATTARKFLGSLAAPASSPPQHPAGPHVAVTTPGKSELKPEPASPTTRPARDGLGSQHTIVVTGDVAPVETRDEEKHRRLRETRRFGYALVGLGVVLGVIALKLGFDDKDTYSVGFGISAGAVGVGGVAVLSYVADQRSAARTVAWSPVIGAGFAGVALAGPLP